MSVRGDLSALYLCLRRGLLREACRRGLLTDAQLARLLRELRP